MADPCESKTGTIAHFRRPTRGHAADGQVSLVALDLPLKALAWESAEGKAWLSYNSPEENTPIRPGGQVEFVGAELRKAARPDRADDRAFYMNVLMNGLTKEGYRFVGMTSDEILMERPVR